ncbi:iron(III) transport system permease protein [Idiomarina fontislapidosi]|uniref:Iron ABC transporter permease n=1 Tax=Idiomarina fontislapidosi TaxID=263723 RepID=A0A432YAZ2_9GAMM|nr:iron ABC transporter permease [Idiomarina fontislapidosi]PYE35228.1 iron(III) transport system permease protein [Idiomarina fontislapidosi]RUO58124.1 iron ABC transporter permease [Idiomarina fontislapidosi]
MTRGPLVLFGVAALVGLPLIVVALSLLNPNWDILSHLWQTVIPEYISHSLILLVSVGLGVTLLGVSTAWCVSQYDFPGWRWVSWGLLLPLAMPAYISAYTYTGLLDYAGPVQQALRDTFDLSIGEYWFPSIRSIEGAIFVLSLVLYPYVYLITRAAFMQQSTAAFESARTLGAGPIRSFFRVALPLARPAIATGVTLALMETLADYGTMEYFGVTVFTTGIFRTWYGMGDAQGALQLASILLLFVIVLILIERYSRRQAKFYQRRSQNNSFRKPLRGKAAWLASAVCWLPILLGFIIPASQLLMWSIERADIWTQASFWQLTLNTLWLGLLAATITVALALWLAYGRRRHPTRAIRTAITTAGLGYAIPGIVIAVGILIPLAWLDHRIIDFSKSVFDVNPGLLLSGTVVALIFAYTVRFLSISLQTISSGLEQITPQMDDSARTLGASSRRIMTRIHLPLLKSSILAALILVLVDVMKELPATLVLRPFNFNTLAVKAFEMASDERLADAGPPALMIVLVGLIPVLMLSRALRTQTIKTGD